MADEATERSDGSVGLEGGGSVDTRRAVGGSVGATGGGSEASRRRHAAPLRRASPAQRSYMVALRKRCRQNGPSPFHGSANASSALQHTGSPQLRSSAVSCASKASRALASAHRPPAFSPEWVPKPQQTASSMLGGATAVERLQPTAPPPSELQPLDRASSAPELQVTPPGAKRKRSGTPDGDSHDRTQSPICEAGDSVAVVLSGGTVELWDGAEWDHKERATMLQNQLIVERAARAEAERRVRELEHRLQIASDEATRHATATVNRLTKENRRLVQRLAAAAQI